MFPLLRAQIPTQLGVVAGMLLFLAPWIHAAVPPAETARLTGIYEASRAHFRSAPDNPRAAWEFARACFDRSEVLEVSAVKASVANEGIQACRTALERAPATAELHYYLGLNLGQLAQTKTLGALRLVRQMEEVWQKARTLDETLDFAGADRSLGMLYAECPRPPLGVGGKDKARRHLERAVQLAPQHPENRIYLAEQLLRWGDRDAAGRQLAELETLLPSARTRLAGESWSAAWSQWDRRIQNLRERLKTHP